MFNLLSNKNLTKAQKLKKIIHSKKLEFLMEAHSGMSAKIVEEAGFQGIWGSGLSISAALGVRDNNEASWTQVLEVAEFMNDATEIPILLDGDTGYGNFNNTRRLVKKLEQRGIAGVCIEDKIFPKRNSYIKDRKQELCDIEEFCNKIKAAKDTIVDQDFCLVARTESLICNKSLSHALDRAKAYQEVGASAVLVHSKSRSVDEIQEFMLKWDNSCPIIIVPTTYYTTATDLFSNIGISTVIWANHLLRASVKAMQQVAADIYNQQSLVSIENRISSIHEIFRLQNEHELKQAEQKYLNSD